jgi:hypothetical protein
LVGNGLVDEEIDDEIGSPGSSPESEKRKREKFPYEFLVQTGGNLYHNNAFNSSHLGMTRYGKCIFYAALIIVAYNSILILYNIISLLQSLSSGDDFHDVTITMFDNREYVLPFTQFEWIRF